LLCLSSLASPSPLHFLLYPIASHPSLTTLSRGFPTLMTLTHSLRPNSHHAPARRYHPPRHHA
jgi:hypothetical protein